MEWFQAAPVQPNREKDSGEQLPSDVLMDNMSDGSGYLWDSTENDRDKLANNR